MMNEIDKFALRIADILVQKKLTIATAESCSGGLIGHIMTNISGSSQFFDRGIISYSNQAKMELLDVSADILEEYGAVSEPVAGAMAEGVRRKSGVDIGISSTGVAGPTGGSDEKPVGLVYIAVATDKVKTVKECRFTGNRKEIKFQASTAALDLVRMVLCEHL